MENQNSRKSKISSEKWDPRFMALAKNVAEWSTCHRRKVGAVIVIDKRIISTGYNGAPTGMENCLERGYCVREKLGIESGTRREVCYATDAEQNAITQAAKLGTPIDGATLYVTHQPCAICTKLIISSGIKRIVYGYDYPDEFSMNLLKEANIELKHLPYKED